MSCLQLCVYPVQVTKMVNLSKQKKILKIILLAQSVEVIVLRSEFVVMAVVCGITRSAQA